MSDKEKIRAEVERMRHVRYMSCGDRAFTGRQRADILNEYEVLGKVLEFIDSIPGQPESKDLEGVAEEYCGDEPEYDPLRWGEKETTSKVLDFIDSNPEDTTSKDLREAAIKYTVEVKGYPGIANKTDKKVLKAYKAGVNWRQKHLWHDAQGDDLPAIDREVIALQGRKVVFAHRPYKYTKVWNEDLGEKQIVEVMRYDKGGWNMEGVTYWLDAPLPEGIE